MFINIQVSDSYSRTSYNRLTLKKYLKVHQDGLDMWGIPISKYNNIMSIMFNKLNNRADSFLRKARYLSNIFSVALFQGTLIYSRSPQ